MAPMPLRNCRAAYSIQPPPAFILKPESVMYGHHCYHRILICLVITHYYLPIYQSNLEAESICRRHAHQIKMPY
jgi:hypothetical protein